MLHCGRRSRKNSSQPPATANLKWRLFIDTAAETPDDIYPDADGPASRPGTRAAGCQHPAVLRSGIGIR